MASPAKAKFDVFLSYSHEDGEWVEALARRLEDEHKFRVWLDRWRLTPGKSWQQEMARGLEETTTCAVCIGEKTPEGWFREEIERALDLQTKDDHFSVIPVLLPDTSSDMVPAFVGLRTWADFRIGRDQEYADRVLVQGIKGQPIGRWPRRRAGRKGSSLHSYELRLRELQRLRQVGLLDEVVVEFQRKILSKWFEKEA